MGPNPPPSLRHGPLPAQGPNLAGYLPTNLLPFAERDPRVVPVCASEQTLGPATAWTTQSCDEPTSSLLAVAGRLGPLLARLLPARHGRGGRLGRPCPQALAVL